MWSKSVAALAVAQLLAAPVSAQWPAATDEIEDLMVLQSGYRAREFAKIITPCTNEAVEGFNIAAGMVRTAFHDIAAYNAATGTNGLDASIGYEMAGDFAQHNTGPGFNATVSYCYEFFNSQVSIADCIALSVATAVRTCGGPQIPLKAGRKDATKAGANDLPDAGDSQDTFAKRFTRMGYSTSEMIQLTACGHTLGGVHRPQNPVILDGQQGPKPPRRKRQDSNLVATFDGTDAVFDNRVVTQYLDGTSTSPLVNGQNEKFNSDKHIFSIDKDVTCKAMSSPDAFNGACQTVMAKMLDTVPRGVQLSKVINPYSVKPYNLNLNVIEHGESLLFTGEVRVFGKPSNVKINVKDDSGKVCDDCSISATFIGTSGNSDYQFSFFGFSGKVKTISAFEVVADGKTYRNGGNGFPVNGNAFVQYDSSSLSGSDLKVVVAVRASQQGVPALTVSTKTDHVFNTLPSLKQSSLSVSKICSDKLWTYYSAVGTVAKADSAKLDVTIGGKSIDAFRSLNFKSSGIAPVCDATTSTTTTTTTTTTSSATSTTDATTTDAGTTTDDSASTTTTTTDTVDPASTTGTKSTTKGGKSTTTTTTTTKATTKGPVSTTGKSTSTTSKSDDGTKTTTSKSTYTPPSWDNYSPPKKDAPADKAADVVSKIYKHNYLNPAPSGGTDGGDKNIEDLKQIVVVIVTEKPVFKTATVIQIGGDNDWVDVPDTVKAGVPYYPTDKAGEKPTDKYVAPTSNYFKPTATQWSAVPTKGADSSQWSPVPSKVADTTQWSALPSKAPAGTETKKWAPVATFTGAAGRNEVAMMGVAAIMGAVAMVL